MTDKQVMIDGVDVSGCECYNPNIKMDCLLYPLQSDACKNNPNCYYKQLARKEQKCKELKEINSTLLEYRRHAVTCQECYEDDLEDGKTSNKELRKLKQTLTEIKEIAEGMHDLWINKTPYTDINNLAEHLLECELNRIRYKLDEISECEMNNEN